MIGKKISHYKILEELGRGGMGEVYLAEDTKLEREVALKFLPIHYTKDKEINKRFRREAKAAAKLNHPNIITVHEIGEFEGRAYITMEHVQGCSLRNEISKGPLPVDVTIDIAKQIAEGLSKAHAAGIIQPDERIQNK